MSVELMRYAYLQYTMKYDNKSMDWKDNSTTVSFSMLLAVLHYCNMLASVTGIPPPPPHTHTHTLTHALDKLCGL